MSTTNYSFNLPNFDVATWHDDVNNNFRAIDAILALFVPSSVIGIWQNATVYAVAERAADNVTNEVYQVAVAHTSAASPTTFSSDRTANPTYWTLLGTATVTDLDGISDVSAASPAAGDVLYRSGANWINAQPGNAGLATFAQGALADTALQTADVGTAAFSAITDFATAAQGVKADNSAQLNVTNTFTIAQIIELTDNSASSGPQYTLQRKSSSPAAADNLATIPFKGNNSSGGLVDYAVILANLVDPTAGAEDGRLDINTNVAGTIARRLSIQAGIHTRNAGGDKGVDTFNSLGYFMGTVQWTKGTGTPEGVVTAPIGSLFSRTDGGAGTTLYIKESGAGNTGWAGV